MAKILPLSDTHQPTSGNSSLIPSAAALCPWAAPEDRQPLPGVRLHHRLQLRLHLGHLGRDQVSV
jgi:hypothetical protein